MTHRGFSHIGLSTLDLDKTRAFYEGMLGFKAVVAHTITIEEGGQLASTTVSVFGSLGAVTPGCQRTGNKTNKVNTAALRIFRK